MSAFLVTERHVMTLANAVSKHCSERRSLTQGEVEHVANTLWAENNKSVNYRYKRRNKTPVLTGDYPMGDKDYMQLTQLYKLARCYGYQSCEHPTYEKSKAYKIIKDLESALAYKIVSESREYDNAAWDI
jgi:hypothetical protein